MTELFKVHLKSITILAYGLKAKSYFPDGGGLKTIYKFTADVGNTDTRIEIFCLRIGVKYENING